MKNFSCFLNQLIGEKGQGTLADEIRVDGAVLSKFRSGQGCINISALDKIFEISETVIISKMEFNRLHDALETMTLLWIQERKKK